MFYVCFDVQRRGRQVGKCLQNIPVINLHMAHLEFSTETEQGLLHHPLKA